jgi:ornithine--oxo-acid transaminase
MLACDHESVKPDILCLGKALSGGTMPVSAVLADDEVMLTIKPGEHGSTYGGNPLASAVALESLKVLVDEDLATKSRQRGEQLLSGLKALQAKFNVIESVRGLGLFIAMVIRPSAAGDELAWDLCMKFSELGLLAKPTHGNIIRLAPPLVISEIQIDEALGIIEKALASLPK